MGTYEFMLVVTSPEDIGKIPMEIRDLQLTNTRGKYSNPFGYFLLKEGKKYSNIGAVFVITDGAGDYIKPENPKKWYWFLSENYRSCIPKNSYIFSLKDLNGNFVGTLGVEWTTKPKKLSDSSLEDLRTKAISIGTILSTYLYTQQLK